MLNDSQKHPYIEIMDSTLRDGEQTSGVSFLPHEKLMIARQLLKKVNVDRLEVASARVSEGEKEAVRKICRIAEADGMLGRIEVLGFVDGKQSVDWIRDCGGRVINLLAKGSYRHCMQQLHKQPQEHLDEVMRVIDYAYNRQMTVNLYLEDWSGGMKDSPDYVFWMMDALKDMPVRRFLLPDTLGIINPLQVVEYIRKMIRRCPQRLRPCRVQHLGCRAERMPWCSRHSQRPRGALWQRSPCQCAGHSERSIPRTHLYRRKPAQCRQPIGRGL